LLFLFGYSAWLWVLLLVQRVVLGFYRLTSLLLPKAAADPLPRIHWEAGIGFAMLFIGVMGIEALQMQSMGARASLPAGAGGQLGQLLAQAMSHGFGRTG